MGETVNARVQFRIDTLSNWNLDNPVILKGEFALVDNNGTVSIKVGDGFKKFSELPFNVPVTTTGIYKGVIKPVDVPVDASDGVFYVTAIQGVYPNCGNVQVTKNFAIISKFAGQWNVSESNVIDLTNILSRLTDIEAKIVGFSTIANSEFLWALVDTNDQFLLGQRTNGTLYSPAFNFEEVKRILSVLSETDKAFDIRIAAIEGKVGYFSVLDNTEFIDARTDANGKLYWAWRNDGMPYSPLIDFSNLVYSLASLASRSTTNEAAIANFLTRIVALEAVSPYFQVVTTPEYLLAFVDNNGALLLGFKTDGTLYSPSFDFKLTDITSQLAKINSSLFTSSVNDGDNRIMVDQDNDGRVLGFYRANGSRYQPLLESREITVTDSLKFTPESFLKLIQDLKTAGLNAVDSFAQTLSKTQYKVNLFYGVTAAYDISTRGYQGCPTIGYENGHLFAAWFCNKPGANESFGDYTVVYVSEDFGATWKKDVLIIAPENPYGRIVDPMFWNDKNGNLYLSSQRVSGIWDGAAGGDWCLKLRYINGNIETSNFVRMFDGDMNTKPTLLTSGDTVLYATSAWGFTQSVVNGFNITPTPPLVSGLYVYKSLYTDLNVIDAPVKLAKPVTNLVRVYDEPMIVELSKNNLLLLKRTNSDGISKLTSSDNGTTWSAESKFTLVGNTPSSRFYFGRLKSGSILLVTHASTIREKLTAYLSIDNGASFPYSLLIDSRFGQSYPDVIELNGYIYIIYDFNRTPEGKIYLTKITEQNIFDGNTPAVNNAITANTSIISKLQ